MNANLLIHVAAQIAIQIFVQYCFLEAYHDLHPDPATRSPWYRAWALLLSVAVGCAYFYLVPL